MDTKKVYGIIAGPNKDILFDACKYAYSKNSTIKVDFTVVIGYTAPPSDPRSAYIPMKIGDFKIVGITHEDGSGESFLLQGYCKADLSSTGGVSTSYSDYRFKAYYNAKSRRGHVKFVE